MKRWCLAKAEKNSLSWITDLAGRMLCLTLFLLLSVLVWTATTAEQSEFEILADIKHELGIDQSVIDYLFIDGVNKLSNLSGLKGLKKEMKKLKKVFLKSKQQVFNIMQQNQQLSKIQILQWAIENAKETAGIDYYPKVEKRGNQHSVLFVYKEYISTKDIKVILKNFMRQGTSSVPEGYVFDDESRYTFTDNEVMEARDRFHMILCDTIDTLTGQLPTVRLSKEKGKYAIYY